MCRGGGIEHGCRDKKLQQLGEEGVGTGVGGCVASVGAVAAAAPHVMV